MSELSDDIEMRTCDSCKKKFSMFGGDLCVAFKKAVPPSAYDYYPVCVCCQCLQEATVETLQ